MVLIPILDLFYEFLVSEGTAGSFHRYWKWRTAGKKLLPRITRSKHDDWVWPPTTMNLLMFYKFGKGLFNNIAAFV